MKPRTVMVMLEIETDASLSELRSRGRWAGSCRLFSHSTFRINQAQANVIQPVKKAKRK